MAGVFSVASQSHIGGFHTNTTLDFSGESMDMKVGIVRKLWPLCLSNFYVSESLPPLGPSPLESLKHI